MNSRTTLGDYLTLQRGFDITKSEQNEGIYPVVSSSGINSYHNEYKVEGSGVVIGRKGTLGTSFFLPSKFWPHDTSLWVKDFKGNDPKFIYYYLKVLPLEKLDSGSANPTLNRNVVHLVKAQFPTVEKQINISKILSSLDKKIELNNKINTELEAMAKLIYDYWFIQFDFPDKNGKPYKSSGGKMVWNEELKREIPEGWVAGPLEKYLKTELGGTPSTKKSEYWEGDIPWLNSGEIANFPIVESEETISRVGINKSATALMPKGSCMISITRHLRPSILGIDACANQSVVGIYETENIKSSYIYPYLVNEIPRLMTLRTGAQQPHINKDTIDVSPFLMPESIILDSYYGIVDSMYKQIISNAQQSKTLTELRDWLLPMLINGQVTVGDSVK